MAGKISRYYPKEQNGNSKDPLNEIVKLISLRSVRQWFRKDNTFF